MTLFEVAATVTDVSMTLRHDHPQTPPFRTTRRRRKNRNRHPAPHQPIEPLPTLGPGMLKMWAELRRYHVDGIKASPLQSDLRYWTCAIRGPEDTPYAGGWFLLDLVITDQFPFSPPRVKFKTRIEHPNINKRGEIDCDILKEQWSPALRSLHTILLSLQSFLDTPVTGACAKRQDLALLYDTDQESYNRLVARSTKLYADLSTAVSLDSEIQDGLRRMFRAAADQEPNRIFPEDLIDLTLSFCDFGAYTFSQRNLPHLGALDLPESLGLPSLLY